MRVCACAYDIFRYYTLRVIYKLLTKLLSYLKCCFNKQKCYDSEVKQVILTTIYFKISLETNDVWEICVYENGFPFPSFSLLYVRIFNKLIKLK